MTANRPLALKDDPARLSIDSYALRFTQRVIYSDVDIMRHINNIAAARYCEEGRVDLIIKVFSGARNRYPDDGLMLLASQQIDYLRQGHYPGDVEIATSIAAIGTRSFTIHQGVFQHAHCIALCNGVMVKADEHGPTDLTATERQALEALKR